MLPEYLYLCIHVSTNVKVCDIIIHTAQVEEGYIQRAFIVLRYAVILWEVRCTRLYLVLAAILEEYNLIPPMGCSLYDKNCLIPCSPYTFVPITL